MMPRPGCVAGRSPDSEGGQNGKDRDAAAPMHAIGFRRCRQVIKAAKLGCRTETAP